ncbi:solute carrier family 41 member 1 [Cylindrobasidium torrendii FP15055 ss-10]|uniref:Solute carrier family 41 member 1 n=1 Tax=Cylindrobasidium torrendii FP15055 ss-10 TaxID=1314674 RepID=A0A0D7BNV3_9AGAR|nr:solute carrier family 41 member 1 [Cylindrobasidium torrendii FP15055 ss-10]
MTAGREDDDVELAPLSKNAETYDNDDDNGVDSDADAQALLGAHGSSDGQRAKSWYGEPDTAGLWPQVKGIVTESAPTLLFSTIGLMLSGELLDHVTHWRAMVQVDQLIMIIPVVLNLKGNLEMNLSARLGTAANMGHLDDPSTRRQIILGNLSLLQVQATVVSFIAACVSLVLGLIVPRNSEAPPTEARSLWSRRPRPILPPVRERKSGIAEFVMVASSAMSAACLSSIILGSFMCGLIVLCRRLGRDPDNIAPPIAACLGDLVTLVLLGAVSMVLIPFLHTPMPAIVMLILVLSAVACGFSLRRNTHVRDLIWQGWSPLFGAMVISSATGIILDLFVSRYEDFALLAVIISGLPGGVGSIFISRLSTALHAATTSMRGDTHKGPSNKVVMTTLLLITVPVEVIFLAMLYGFGWIDLPIIFTVFSVGFFCVAVFTSLITGKWLVNLLWWRDLDPDMYALPLHSAGMDLIGQLLLVLCFEIVSLMGVTVAVRAKHKR